MGKLKRETCPICGVKWKKPFWHLWHKHTKGELVKLILKILGLEGPSRG